MMALLLHGAIEPINDVLHPSGCFKRRGRLKYDAKALTVGAKSLDMVRHRLIFAAMVLILGIVLEQYAVQLLDVILGRSDGIKALENHVHRVGISCHFLL